MNRVIAAAGRRASDFRDGARSNAMAPPEEWTKQETQVTVRRGAARAHVCAYAHAYACSSRFSGERGAKVSDRYFFYDLTRERAS